MLSAKRSKHFLSSLPKVEASVAKTLIFFPAARSPLASLYPILGQIFGRGARKSYSCKLPPSVNCLSTFLVLSLARHFPVLVILALSSIV